jgi:hypothetical protein
LPKMSMSGVMSLTSSSTRDDDRWTSSSGSDMTATKSQLLDSEAGFDLFGSVLEQLRQPRNIARRLRRSRPDRLHRVVDLVDYEIYPARAEALLLKLVA